MYQIQNNISFGHAENSMAFCELERGWERNMFLAREAFSYIQRDNKNLKIV